MIRYFKLVDGTRLIAKVLETPGQIVDGKAVNEWHIDKPLEIQEQFTPQGVQLGISGLDYIPGVSQQINSLHLKPEHVMWSYPATDTASATWTKATTGIEVAPASALQIAKR